jgi:hypothetical protein
MNTLKCQNQIKVSQTPTCMEQTDILRVWQTPTCMEQTDILRVWTRVPIRQELLVKWTSYISLSVTSISDTGHFLVASMKDSSVSYAKVLPASRYVQC